jgi:YD repeat-containing protein
MGPRSRTYTDRAGRTVRELAEVALNHDAQPASRRWTVRDTAYSDTGVPVLKTQPYFLGTGSSTTTGSDDHGLDVSTVDALGRVVRIDSADPAGSVQATLHGYTRRWARTVVEHSGLSTTTTNPQGHTRREEKNVDGRVVRITDASGAQLAHEHDAFGLLVQTQDALQNLVRMGYDIRGRKTRLEDPDTGLWTYEYNALGELVRQQSPNQRAATRPASSTPPWLTTSWAG